MIRMGRLIEESAMIVMRPDDLLEFSRMAYSSVKKIVEWSRPELIETGFFPNEEALLSKIPFRTGNLLLLYGGGGRDALALAQYGFTVTAVDFVPELLEKAREIGARKGFNIDCQVNEISRLKLPQNTYDITWFSYSTYSITPTRKRRTDLLKRIGESLRPDGLVVCQFFWQPERVMSSRKSSFFHLLAGLTFGYRQFEAGDHLRQTEFLHAFVDERSIRTEFAESGYDVLYLEFFPNWKAGGAILKKIGPL